MTSFWSGWIIILTTLTIIGISWILVANRKGQAKSGDQTTGHVYDGIEEFDNPLPAWWFYMFIATIVWGVAYLLAYPGMGNYPGLLGWTQIGQHDAEVARAELKYQEMRDKYLALPIAEIATDPVVRKMGQRLFRNNCAQCHGSDAKGTQGFPNLADNDWIFSGAPNAIKSTISDGRQATMPAWSAILGDQGVAETTAYILSLNGRTTDESLSDAGKKRFQTYCIACHGVDGTGNPMLGAPNLTNGIWLYGGTQSQVAQSISDGRNGVMPAHKEMLGEDKIHIIAAYVYSLSH
ncbi:MAG: cytochrome-c oxidase, cbb3-type subunit III [Halieaceae bacterium]|jgi:cytochrome c oxidase cbb3-type subunit III|nr:cytochrome-c oxidase, cbb3-type subunit III [Halieaceae bacterium]